MALAGPVLSLTFSLAVFWVRSYFLRMRISQLTLFERILVFHVHLGAIWNTGSGGTGSGGAGGPGIGSSISGAFHSN